MNHNNITEENFEAWNEEMVKRHSTILEYKNSNPIVRFIEGERVRWVVRLVDAKNTDTILDAGCGAGNILEEIRCGKLFGVDISETLVARAHQRMKERALIVRGNVEDMVKLFPNTTFTKIYSSEVIEHILHPDIMLSEMHKLIDAKGAVVISIPNESLIKFAKRILIIFGLFRIVLGERDKKSVQYDWHLHDFDLNKLKTLV